ncbi:MAG: YdcF family protein [Bacteroidota bacterium]
MKAKPKKWLKRGGISLLLLGLGLISWNTFQIYQYSLRYSDQAAPVAIILGAGSHHGNLSPVFRERVEEGISLWQEKRVDYLLFTGGMGQGEEIADSDAARQYARERGIPGTAIFTEKSSTITYENLLEARKIMRQQHWESALLVSDPLHMKRAMSMCDALDITAYSVPTRTSMYRSRSTKWGFLLYESFYYHLGKLTYKH